MTPPDASRRPTTLALGAFVAALLVAVYGLSFSGTFTSDDEHLFASSAQSLARLGRINTDAAYGNTRLRWLEALPDYRDVEPGQAAIGSLLVRWADLAGVGAAQSLFLLNAFTTAFTAAVVLFTVAELGYPRRVAAACALAYGLGTIAWPYSKTYFRDPLAALMLAAACLCFEIALADRRPVRTRALAAGLAVVLLGGGMLAKSTVGAAVLVLPIVAIVRAWRGRTRWRRLIAPVGATLAIGAAVVGAAIVAPASGPFSRFSASYLTFLFDFFLHAPRAEFWPAVLGPLISPGKSLFLYSPVLLIALASVPIAGRTKWRQLLVPWSVLAALVVAQALFYDDEWWGHTNWGLRYLLPSVPLLTVACAPAAQAILESRSRGWRAVAAVLLGLSVVVQLGGIAIAAPAYYPVLAAVQPEDAWRLALWQPRYSAIVGHWRMLMQGAPWNFAWTRTWSADPLPIALANFGWLVAAAAAASGIHCSLEGSADRRWTGGLLATSIGLSLFLPFAMLRAYSRDPAYFGDTAAFRAAAEHVERRAEAGDVVLVQGYGQPLWFCILNHSRLPVEWYALPVRFPSDDELRQAAETADATAALDPWAVTLFESLPGRYRRVWLINALDSPPGGFELDRQWLAARHLLSSERAFEGGAQVRVSLFDVEHPRP